MTSDELDLVGSVVDFITSRYGFLGSDIRLHPKIEYHGRMLTPDVVVYGVKNSEPVAAMVAEVRQRIDPLSIEQLMKYLRAVGAQYGIVSSGQNYIFFYQALPDHFIEIPYIPLEKETKIMFRKDRLNNYPNLSFKFEKISWMISDYFRYQGRFVNVLDIISSFQKILLCKIVDEKSSNPESLFSVGSLDLDHNGNQLDKDEVFKRISLLFEQVKITYPDIFLQEHESDLGLSKDVIFAIVLELQSYSILRADRQTLRQSYENVIQVLMDKSRYKDLNEIVTPKAVTDFVVSLLKPSTDHKILDPTVGLGNFLTSCISYIENKSESSIPFSNPDRPLYENLYGVERNNGLASLTRVSLLLNGGNYKHVISADSLVSPNEFLSTFELREGFDFVLTNPPFGGEVEPRIANRFRFGKEYKIHSTECLFIELGLQALKVHGKMAIILPESFLFKEGKVAKVREFLLNNGLVSAIISFPPGVFPIKGMRSSLVLLSKSPQSQSTHASGYKIFMAKISDTMHLRLRDSEFLNKIIVRYFDFLQGRVIDSVEEHAIFTIDSSRLKNTMWSVSRHIPQPIQSPHALESKYPKYKLIDLAELTRGVSIPVSKYLDHPCGSTVPFIRISDLIDRKINNVKIVYVNPNEIPNANRYSVKEGDILTSIKLSIGKIAIVTKEYTNSIISSQIARLRIKTELIIPRYLCYLLSSGYIKRQIDKITYYAITGMSQVSIQNLKGLEIPLPSINRQKEIINEIMHEESEYRASVNYTIEERIDAALDRS